MNNADTVGNAVTSSTTNVVNNILLFIPNLVSGLIILLIGWILATVLKTLIEKGISFLNPEKYLSRAGIGEGHFLRKWPMILANIVYWFVFLTFLIPAFNAWQLPMITSILTQFLTYIPNVFAAAIIGFIGLIFANLAFDVVKNASQDMGAKASVTLGNMAKYALIGLTVLMALNQLGVGSSLIQILLAGFVLMIALAGGLAFGLGGQDAARLFLNKLISQKSKIRAK